MRVGLTDAASARPDALSGGMRQRAALARTLMEDRPVVLMDEPFSGLDALTRLRLQALAAELLAGRTVLLVTHDPLEALRLGEHILIMNGRPATLSVLPDLPGIPPRDPGDPAVQDAYRAILRLLGAV
jgi:putative hydroxymethylpyrimidine transport system ATP-binding protein